MLSRRVFIHLYSSGNFLHKSHDQQNLLLHKRGLLRSSRVLDWSTCPWGGGFAGSPSRTGENYFTKIRIWLYACKNDVYIYIIYLCTILYITHTSSYAKTAYKMQTLTYQVLHTICTPSKTLLRDPFICRDFVKVGCKCCQMCFERCKWPAVLPEKYQPSSTSKKTLHLQSHPHLCKFNAHLRSWDQYGVPSCKTCRWDFSLLQVYASVNLVHVYLWSDFLTEWSLHIKNHC